MEQNNNQESPLTQRREAPQNRSSVAIIILILLSIILAVTNPSGLDYAQFKAEQTGSEPNVLSGLLSNDEVRNYIFFSIFASPATDVDTDKIIVIKYLGIAGEFAPIGRNQFVNKRYYTHKRSEKNGLVFQETETSNISEPTSDFEDIPLFDDDQVSPKADDLEFVLQAAALTDAAKANALLERISDVGVPVYSDNVGGLTRVRVGPYRSREDAVNAAVKLAEHGIVSQVIQRQVP